MAGKLYLGSTEVTPITGGTQINNQDKTITENGTYTADSGYTGLGTVSVNVQGGKDYPSDIVFRTPDNVTSITQDEKYTGFLPLEASFTSVSFDLNKVEKLSGDSIFEAFACGREYNIDYINIPSMEINGWDVFFMSFEMETGYSIGDINIGEVVCIVGGGGGYEFCMCFKDAPITGNVVLDIKEMGDDCFEMTFANCTFTNKNISFNKLTKVGSWSFLYCFAGSNVEVLNFPALKSDSFGTNTDCFEDMVVGCTGVTVHFPSNLQSVIGQWADVLGGFGGTNTTVLFGLPATE